MSEYFCFKIDDAYFAVTDDILDRVSKIKDYYYVKTNSEFICSYYYDRYLPTNFLVFAKDDEDFKKWMDGLAPKKEMLSHVTWRHISEDTILYESSLFENGDLEDRVIHVIDSVDDQDKHINTIGSIDSDANTLDVRKVLRLDF